MAWKSQTQFEERLKRHGWVYLGGGLFSNVYGKKGSDKVIKVNDVRDAWCEYVYHAAKRGFAGSCAPKIYSMKHIKAGADKFSVTLMERLDTTILKIEHKTDDTSTQAIEWYRSIKHELGYYRYDSPPQIMAETKQFVSLLKDLQKHIGAIADLHNANCMVKGDRTVLTDPFSNRYGVTPEEWQVPARVRSHEFAAFPTQPTKTSIWDYRRI